MKRLKGKTANIGRTEGRICLLKSRPSVQKREMKDPEGEILRLRAALQRAERQLKEEQEQADGVAKELLQAHRMLLCDGSFRERIEERIRNEQVNAEYAAGQTGEELEAMFEAMGDSYMKARAEDMRQTAGRVIDSLMDTREEIVPETPVILCAQELNPGQLIRMDRDRVLGLVSEKGSRLSHTAMLAALYGLPYLIGIDISEITDGETAVLDADEGELILSPDEETKRDGREKENGRRDERTEDCIKTEMKVYADIASDKDLETAVRYGADGIGLLRTEFLFMDREEAPDEEEQYQLYSRVLETMKGKKVRIRTLDAGADKPAAWMKLAKEENPALGLRGIRVSLRYPALFRVQLRALLRAACRGNEEILFPMVSSERELKQIREQLGMAVRELEERGEAFRIPPIGIMVETPAAALLCEELGQMADFLSIGTNDLTQYTLAADRTSEMLETYFEEDHKAVLKLIRMTIKGGRRNRIPVSVCGRLGADPGLFPIFVRDGLDAVCVPAVVIPEVRRRIAEAESAVVSNCY